MVIVGSDVLQRPDSDAVYRAVVAIATSGAKPDKDWRSLNVLHRVSIWRRCFHTDYCPSLFMSVLFLAGSQPGGSIGCSLQGWAHDGEAQGNQVSLPIGGGMSVCKWTPCLHGLAMGECSKHIDTRFH